MEKGKEATLFALFGPVGMRVEGITADSGVCNDGMARPVDDDDDGVVAVVSASDMPVHPSLSSPVTPEAIPAALETAVELDKAGSMILFKVLVSSGMSGKRTSCGYVPLWRRSYQRFNLPSIDSSTTRLRRCEKEVCCSHKLSRILSKQN